MSIDTATRDGIATISIARPDKKNALTTAMYRSMAEALRAADAAPAVRAVVIGGQRGIFTAGNDLKDFMQQPPQGTDSPAVEFMNALLDIRKPVIAAVTGHAIGVGVTMLLHCDFVYVAEDARLEMPFVNLGLVPEFGSSLLLPLLMGRVRATEKLLLGEPVSATEAAGCGLASAVLPGDQVVPHALAVAARLAALPPGAVQQSLQLIRGSCRSAVLGAIQRESEAFEARLRSPEAAEAFQAFFERRKPDFTRF